MLGIEAGVKLADGLPQFLKLGLQARHVRTATLRLHAQLLLHMLGFLGQPLGRLVETCGMQVADGLAQMLQALFHRGLFRILYRAAFAVLPLDTSLIAIAPLGHVRGLLAQFLHLAHDGVGLIILTCRLQFFGLLFQFTHLFAHLFRRHGTALTFSVRILTAEFRFELVEAALQFFRTLLVATFTRFLEFRPRVFEFLLEIGAMVIATGLVTAAFLRHARKLFTQFLHLAPDGIGLVFLAGGL